MLIIVVYVKILLLVKEERVYFQVFSVFRGSFYCFYCVKIWYGKYFFERQFYYL